MTEPTQDEQWLPIPGYNGRYEASTAGRIRSTLARGGSTRVLKAVRDVAGYERVALALSRDVLAVTQRVHRMIALTFLGPCPDGQQVRHLDGDNGNNALSNLAYGTALQNTQDKIRHGTYYRGPEIGMRKTHCPWGHPYDDANTYVYPDGRRTCRICMRSRSVRRDKAGTSAPGA